MIHSFRHAVTPADISVLSQDTIFDDSIHSSVGGSLEDESIIFSDDSFSSPPTPKRRVIKPRLSTRVRNPVQKKQEATPPKATIPPRKSVALRSPLVASQTKKTPSLEVPTSKPPSKSVATAKHSENTSSLSLLKTLQTRREIIRRLRELNGKSGIFSE